VIQFKPFCNAYLMWQMLKLRIPEWRHKYQEGLNIKIGDIGKIPMTLPFNWMVPFADQDGPADQLSLF